MARQLTEGPEGRQILLFALPIMAGELLQQLYNTVDGIVVGNFISSDALAAVGSCTSVSNVFLALAIGMSTGCGIVIAQLFGAKRTDALRRTVSTSLILLLALGALFTVLGLVSSGFIMERIIVIEDPDIRSQAALYFRIYSLGLIFQFAYNAVSYILRSVGDSGAALYFLLVSTVTNAVLDVVFVAAFKWGVAGAAAATVIAQAACAAVSFVYMRKRYELFRFSMRELVLDRERLGDCFRMGLPVSCQRIVISCGHLLLQRLVNSFGNSVMSAYTVGSRFDHYISVPVMGFLSAISAFAGQNVGAGRYDRVRRGLRAAVVMDLVFAGVLCAAVYAFAGPLSRLFGVGGETLELSARYLRFVALCYPMFALYIPFNGVVQGSGDTVHSMLTSFLALGGRVTAAYVMAGALGFGCTALWRSCAVGWALASVYIIGYYFTGKWKKRALVRSMETEAD